VGLGDEGRPCPGGPSRGDRYRLLGHRRYAGRDLPAELVMPAGEMVDAALAGLEQGEFVTLPSLPDLADWKAFESARQALFPNLSRSSAATVTGSAVASVTAVIRESERPPFLFQYRSLIDNKFDPWPPNLPQDFGCSQTGFGAIASISLIPAPHCTRQVHERSM
jgi:hypothetical protein